MSFSGKKYVPITDTQNKIVLLRQSAAFGYAGLASIGGRTDRWLTEALSERTCKSNSDAARRIAVAATIAIKKLRIPSNLRKSLVTHTSFVAVGWFRRDASSAEPLIYRISNCYDKTGRPLTHAEGQFSVQTWLSRPNERYLFLVTGQNVPNEILNKLHRRMRCILKANGSRELILRQMVKSMRESAVRNPLIGQELLSVCLPRLACLHPTQLLMTTGEPSSEFASCQNWPAHHYSYETHGPNVVSGTCAFLDFTASSILPNGDSKQRLGGLVFDEKRPQTLTFPCCVLFNDRTDCFVSMRRSGDSIDYLAIYTNEESVKASIQGSDDRLRRIMLYSADDVIGVLDSVSSLRAVVFDPVCSKVGPTKNSVASAGFIKRWLKCQSCNPTPHNTAPN